VGVCLDIITPHWQVELNYPFDKAVEDQPVTRRKWLEASSGKEKIIMLLSPKINPSSVFLRLKKTR
jgi:hypothetical protein